MEDTLTGRVLVRMAGEHYGTDDPTQTQIQAMNEGYRRFRLRYQREYAPMPELEIDWLAAFCRHVDGDEAKFEEDVADAGGLPIGDDYTCR